MDWWKDWWNGISAYQNCQNSHHGCGEVVIAVSPLLTSTGLLCLASVFGPAFGWSWLHVTSDECMLVDTIWVCAGFDSQTEAWLWKTACTTCEYISNGQVKSNWTYKLYITYWYTYVLVSWYSIPSVHSISPFHSPFHRLDTPQITYTLEAMVQLTCTIVHC